jgi:hypothetical protein
MLRFNDRHPPRGALAEWHSLLVARMVDKSTGQARNRELNTVLKYHDGLLFDQVALSWCRVPFRNQLWRGSILSLFLIC